MTLVRDQEFLLRTAVLFLFLWIIHQGIVGPSMNNDGVLYATIAKHMAEGQGSFWFPYSIWGEAAFHHHPPLAFALQSFFFRLLGDAFWVGCPARAAGGYGFDWRELYKISLGPRL